MDFQKKIICIIEDNKPVNKLLSTVLQKSGYECVAFYNGKDALEWLSGNKPTLILIDILLPDIHGTQLLHQIRKQENLNQIPIVAVTGLTGNSSIESLIKDGFYQVINKPLDISKFANTIDLIIKSYNNQKEED